MVRALFFLLPGNQMKLGKALRLIRLFHRLNQTQAAEKLGVSNSFLSEIESNQKSATFELIEKYSEIFQMPVSSIVLFSESLERETPGERLRVAATKKVIKLLEWVSEGEALETHR